MSEKRVSRHDQSTRGVRTSPLFPKSVLQQFDLGQRYVDVKYLPGVGGEFRAGAEPLTVPPLVIDEIRTSR